jgi:hypothetical protein
MFSTKQYAWSSCKIFLFGRIVTGIRGFEYGVKKDKEPLHGAGDEPLAIQSGNKTYNGNLILLQSEFDAMTKAAKALGYADVTDVPGFNVQFSYGNPGAAPTTDTAIGAEFDEAVKGMKQGDKYMEITLPIQFLRLNNQV